MVLSLIWNNLIYLILVLIGLVLLKFVFLPYIKIHSFKGDHITYYFFPFLGIFHYMMKDLKTRRDMMASAKEFSRLFPNKKVLISNLVAKPVIGLRDPEYIKEFVQKPHLYTRAQFAQAMTPLTGYGLLFSEGDTWKRYRRIIASSFHYNFLKDNIHTIQETTQEFLEKITPADYENYSIIKKTQEITGEIVGRIFFGKNLNNYTFEGQPLTRALDQLTIQMSLTIRSPLILIFGSKIMKSNLFPKFKTLLDRVQEFRNTCQRIIQERRASGVESNDLLGILLKTQKAEDPDQRLTDENIINEFVSFFIAGMDTTGHLIGMALYNLARNPQYLKQLKEERDNTYNKEKRVTDEILQKMDLLQCIIKETLRLHTPAVGIGVRSAVEDHKILDLNIKKGDIVRADFYHAFYDERIFEEAEKFIPERWRKERKIDPYAFIPFSAGPRNCIGQHLAIIEAKIIISEFLNKFEFKMKEGYNLGMTVRFLYEPIDELLFDLQPISKTSEN